jgi:hypothetical protein
VNINITLTPCPDADYSIISVNGERVGVAKRLSDGKWIPNGCRKPRKLRAAALFLLTRKYDQAANRVAVLGAILGDFLNEPSS